MRNWLAVARAISLSIYVRDNFSINQSPMSVRLILCFIIFIFRRWGQLENWLAVNRGQSFCKEFTIRVIFPYAPNLNICAKFVCPKFRYRCCCSGIDRLSLKEYLCPCGIIVELMHSLELALSIFPYLGPSWICVIINFWKNLCWRRRQSPNCFLAIK